MVLFLLLHFQKSYDMICNMKNSEKSEAIGKRITSIRLSKRISQLELAEKLGMKGPQLSKLESGRNMPSIKTLTRIEEALNLTDNELTNMRAELLDNRYATPQPDEAPRLAAIHETKNIPSAIEEALKADLIPILDEYIGLQRSLNVPSFVPAELYCQFPGTGPNDAEILAHIIRSSLGAGSAPLSGLVPLLEAQNIRIVFTDRLASEMHAKSYIDNRVQNLVICVSESSTPERQLNDICKELAFACMFIHKSRIMVEQTFANNQFAQSFAQAFLIPRSGIRQLVTQLNIRPRSWSLPLICMMKMRFGVSAQLFIHRLEVLNLIDEFAFESIRGEIHGHYSDIETKYAIDSAEYREHIEPMTHAPELQRNMWLNTLRAAVAAR